MQVGPARVWHSPVVIVFLVAAAFSLGGWIGTWAGEDDQNSLRRELRGSKAELERSGDELDALTKELATLRLNSGVSSGAVADLQSNLSSQQLEIAALREEVTHYREVISPGAVAKGIQISELRLVQGADSNQFVFELRLAQLGAETPLVRGVLGIVVEADAGGEKVEMAMQELGAFDVYPFKVAYRHFQHVSGKFLIPAGHSPLRLVVTLRVDGKVNKPLIRSFPWVVESL